MNNFPKHINTFIGGMDKDTSLNKFENTKYLHADNYRILTEDGSTSGALKSIKGTSLKWALPQYYSYAGHTYIRDKIVLFARGDRVNVSNDNIYYFDPTGVTGTLGASELKYQGDLEIPADTIVDAVGRYESTNIQKVYFTDGTNPLRFCNLLDTNLSGSDPSYLNIFPTFEQSAIDIDTDNNPIQGGNLTGGIIQYTYVLYSINGAETTFGALSIPTLLADGQVDDSYLNIKGVDAETNVNKSVLVTLTNPDSDFFTRVRLIAVHYKDPYINPEIRIVGEYKIDDSIDILDTGTSIGSYTAEEFNSLKNLFTCQHLETKNNYLFAANITEDYIDLPTSVYDTRAYRFSSATNEAIIEDSEGNETEISSTEINANPTNWGIDADHDCICPYNDGFDALTTIDSNLKRQYNSGTPSTLGGEGPNIKYEFVQFTMDLSSKHNTYTQSYGNSPTVDSGSGTPSTYLHDGAGTYGFQYNPYFSDNLTFQRDEIYRFAIVFFDDKGRQTFPKWIADIRMPNYSDIDFYDSTTTMEATAFNVRFTVNITQDLIDADIVGFKIVRADRDVLNSTVLDAGYMGSLKPHDNSLTGYIFPADICMYNNGHESMTGTASVDTSNLSDSYKEYITPELNYNLSNFLNIGEYFHATHRFEYDGALAHRPGATSSPANYSADSIIIKKYITETTFDDPAGSPSNPYQQKFDIDDSRIFSDQSYQGINDSTAFNIPLGTSTVWNYSHGARSIDGTTVGDQARGTCLVVKGTSADGTLGTNDVFAANYTGTPDGALYVLRRRDITPYGGNTYSDRVNTQYIECSEYKDVSSLVAGNTSQETAYGDTIIGIFEHIRTFIPTPEHGCTNLEVLYLPVETKINLGLDHGERFYELLQGDWSNENLLGIKETVGVHEWDATTGDFYTQTKPLYDYNLVYSRPQNIKTYIPEPLDFSDTAINQSDIKVIASERKINGELNDSWATFKFNNELEVDGAYGEITDLINYQGRLLSFQERALAVLSVEDREVVTATDGQLLALGSGGILTRKDYISTKNGTNYKQSIIHTPETLLWYDDNNDAIYTIQSLNEPSLDKVKGMASYFRDKSISDVRTGYDREFNEILINLKTGASTNEVLVYNTLTQSFVSFYDMPWADYIHNDDYIYGIYDGGTNYVTQLHNQDTFTLYGSDFDAELHIVVNPKEEGIHRFDSLKWMTRALNYSDVENFSITFDSLQAYNSYQTTPVYEDSTYFKKRFRTWKHNTLRDNTTNKPRLRDSYLVVKFIFDSGNNRSLLVNDIITHYIPNKH